MVSAVALLSLRIILAGLGGGLGVSWLFLGMFSVGSAPNFSLFLVILQLQLKKNIKFNPKLAARANHKQQTVYRILFAAINEESNK